MERVEERIRRHFGFKGVIARPASLPPQVRDVAVMQEDEKVGR